jgi:flagellar basal-body rod protein FlgB
VAIDLKTVDVLQQALTFHRDRQAVLAGNVANIDTPGYRPYDLTRDDDGNVSQSFDDSGNLQGQDGNAVSLEREMAKIDANRTRYNTSAELTTRRLAMLRYAAGDGT